MTQLLDIKAARLAAEKLMIATPTPANARQHGLLNALEIRVADLKRAVTDVTNAGGIIDPAASAALATLLANL